MSQTLVHAVAILSLVVGAFALVHTIKDDPFSNALFYAVAVLEFALVVVLANGIFALFGADPTTHTGLFVSYLVTMVLVPPVAVLWGIAEKTRWGTGVVAFALIALAVLCERVLQIWAS